MKPPHTHFFSSLKQVEKRLKLDDDGNHPPPPTPPPPPSPSPSPSPSQPPQQQTVTQSTESSTSSPIYFHTHHTNTNTSSSTFNNSSLDHPPHEFLSLTDSLPNPKPQLTNFPENDVVGGVDSMIDLLRLSEYDCKGSQMPNVNPDDMFYANIVKVKGPKCKKEVERLDGWISYFLSNNKEPFRLAHLLLAKAAVVGDGDVFEFPCTVDEFLHNDPPFD